MDCSAKKALVSKENPTKAENRIRKVKIPRARTQRQRARRLEIARTARQLTKRTRRALLARAEGKKSASPLAMEKIVAQTVAAIFAEIVKELNSAQQRESVRAFARPLVPERIAEKTDVAGAAGYVKREVSANPASVSLAVFQHVMEKNVEMTVVGRIAEFAAVTMSARMDSANKNVRPLVTAKSVEMTVAGAFAELAR